MNEEVIIINGDEQIDSPPVPIFSYESIYSNHYIRTDDKNNIIDGWSDSIVHMEDLENCILINDKGGYQFRLKYSDGTLSEENPALWTYDGISRYKYVNGSIIEKTEEEIQQEINEIPPLPPSQMEQMRADIDFIAIMTGVDLT